MYINFKEYSQNNMEKELTKSININTLLLTSALEDTYTTFEQKRSFIEYIHRTALDKYKQDENIPLAQLKSQIISYFNLKDLNIDLYLIDKNYVIIDATFEKDIGLDFMDIPSGKADLDKASKDDEIHIAGNVSIDYMDSSIKIYSLARAHNDKYLEMAFIDPFVYDKLRQTISDISESTKVKINIFRITKTLSGEEYYEDIMNTNNISSKEEWHDSLKRFSLNTATDNEIINIHRQNKIIKTNENIKDGTATIYVPLHTKGNDNALADDYFVLKLEIDISEYMTQWQENENIFILVSLSLLILMLLLYFFIKYNFYIPITKITRNLENEVKITDPVLLNKNDEFGVLAKKYNLLYSKLQDQVKNNLLLLNENKIFIADMVHQIRTPLSVIMTNSSLIEMKTEDQVSSYLTQINSAINMLSNSYEDLSYIISNDTLEYNPIEIDLTDFLNDRIDFFEIISQANHKTITTNIANDLKITMNDTELERLIDNNLSNAIKHSYDKSEIEIVLKKSDDDIVLEFISKGENIRSVSRLFDKNYTESYSAKRSLGLGLNMVKMICEKNNICYSVHSEDNTNTFTYTFKG